jgi:acyl-CoA synthetase (AMP-forming)/AMP-acid ligase II
MTHDNFGDLFWKAAALSPDKIAIEQGDLTLTYGALEDRTQRAAGLLRRLGVGAGHKVFLMLPNDYRLPECFFGALRAGATVVPANIRLGAEALAYVAAHSEAGVMIAHGEVREKAQVRAKVPRSDTLMMDGNMPGVRPTTTAWSRGRVRRARRIPTDPRCSCTSGRRGGPGAC